ncbi:hypothetical protein [Umezawaea sp. Da 62-37]|uniref:hypothetical protein n=1 Tax=Umezawaea sp. Da 62-37 TaxID=3075927 RepID=UPI0028F6D160|nr:hypothetical protein [Umezawaea sp. Da 62-37]WNV90347.1 hypothetical protein RM788_19315 [Umezawaea sp. Da 62-37]
MTLDTREVDEWIAEMTRQGWTHHYFPDREAPIAMASTFWHAGYVDVIQLFDHADAFAYRAPMEQWSGSGADPFKPAAVVWLYGGNPIWTIRATLGLPLPGSAQAPTMPEPPPPMCEVLPGIATKVRAVVIRPNTPSGYSADVVRQVPRNPVER